MRAAQGIHKLSTPWGLAAALWLLMCITPAQAAIRAHYNGYVTYPASDLYPPTLELLIDGCTRIYTQSDPLYGPRAVRNGDLLSVFVTGALSNCGAFLPRPLNKVSIPIIANDLDPGAYRLRLFIFDGRTVELALETGFAFPRATEAPPTPTVADMRPIRHTQIRMASSGQLAHQVWFVHWGSQGPLCDLDVMQEPPTIHIAAKYVRSCWFSPCPGNWWQSLTLLDLSPGLWQVDYTSVHTKDLTSFGTCDLIQGPSRFEGSVSFVVGGTPEPVSTIPVLTEWKAIALLVAILLLIGAAYLQAEKSVRRI